MIRRFEPWGIGDPPKAFSDLTKTVKKAERSAPSDHSSSVGPAPHTRVWRIRRRHRSAS